MLWTPQSEKQALDVAASRITCIVMAILVMAVLSVLIYPQIASELVSLLTCPSMSSGEARDRLDQLCASLTSLGRPICEPLIHLLL